jgi:hypothetical protein
MIDPGTFKSELVRDNRLAGWFKDLISAPVEKAADNRHQLEPLLESEGHLGPRPPSIGLGPEAVEQRSSCAQERSCHEAGDHLPLPAESDAVPCGACLSVVAGEVGEAPEEQAHAHAPRGHGAGYRPRRPMAHLHRADLEEGDHPIDEA